MVFDPRSLDAFVRRLSEALPTGAKELQRDLEHNLRAAVSGAFRRLDLVTREELEVQKGVLSRTRAKLEDLEREVARLEADLLPDGPNYTRPSKSEPRS